MKVNVKKLEVKTDNRGELVELITQASVGNKMFGHLLITTIHPKQTKGKHFHKHKTEWYSVIAGRAELTLIDNKSKEKRELKLISKDPTLVTIYPNIYHEITNKGSKDVLLLVYQDEVFNPKDTDTFY